MSKFISTSILLLYGVSIFAQSERKFELFSPDGRSQVTILAGENLSWSVKRDQQTILTPSSLAVELQTGEVMGKKSRILSAKQVDINEEIGAINYKKNKVSNHCRQLTLFCKGDYGVVFRAYDDGVAYRFFTSRKDSLIIRSEQVEFNFDQDAIAMIPFTSDLRAGDPYSCSFEEFYSDAPLSAIPADTLGYLPSLLRLHPSKKVALLEADVQDYPEMFVKRKQGVVSGLQAVYAGYPLEEKLGGFNRINLIVSKRADYIARVAGNRQYPWRVIVIADQDRDLLNNDMVYRLSAASPMKETEWIKPGKVAWDWWNDWNISHVDFRAGINTPTYQHYIDFAAEQHIEYVVLDEGWSDDWDLGKLNPNIDLPALLEYGRQKNVGLILWSTWYAIAGDMEGWCARYEAMGVKGFKVDFIDRNDQKAISSCYTIAEVAARHHLMLDFHGMFPPQGLQRTWPNVVNFEGVRGMEYSKWSADDRVPAHEVTLPFIRMLAGPMDYTPGAMRNVTRKNARPSNSLPISQGTRCHQLAIYTVFEGPLQMLADNPTTYRKEKESTELIASIPTIYDETIALDGKVGEFVLLARRKGANWFVGGMTNWTSREISLDFSFLGTGKFRADIFQDGINADRDATDYRRIIQDVDASTRISLHLASGGGCVIRISPL